MLALISANGYLDTFELTALAYGLEPDERGHVLVSEAHLASVRRALVVLLRRQGGHPARTDLEFARHPWFWMESDHIDGSEPFG